MSIFSEVKEYVTARQVAESYGLQVRRNGLACCPFHDDKHPSMKVDRNYYCFACGAGGDAIDYVSRMFGLSQFDAACKLIEDFRLPIDVKNHTELDRQERNRIKKKRAEQQRIVKIKERFKRWCNCTIELLKEIQIHIQEVSVFIKGKPPDIIFSEEYAQMLHAEPLVNHWLDILCMGDVEEKQELFLKGRKEVDKIAERVRTAGERIMAGNRGSA